MSWGSDIDVNSMCWVMIIYVLTKNRAVKMVRSSLGRLDGKG